MKKAVCYSCGCQHTLKDTALVSVVVCGLRRKNRKGGAPCGGRLHLYRPGKKCSRPAR